MMMVMMTVAMMMMKAMTMMTMAIIHLASLNTALLQHHQLLANRLQRSELDHIGSHHNC